MEGEVITMQEIFSFRQTGVGEDGAVVGLLPGHRRAPTLPRTAARFGIGVPDAHVRPGRQYQ